MYVRWRPLCILFVMRDDVGFFHHLVMILVKTMNVSIKNIVAQVAAVDRLPRVKQKRHQTGRPAKGSLGQVYFEGIEYFKGIHSYSGIN